MAIYQEKDLRELKYHILTSARHDRAVRGLAGMLGIGVQPLRRILLERLDMQYLENLAGRYEQWEARGDREDPLDRAIGRELFTTYLPLVAPAEMGQIRSEAMASVEQGVPVPEAAARGRARIVEVFGR
jgi:energy-converting hydrogenase A subunit M